MTARKSIPKGKKKNLRRHKEKLSKAEKRVAETNTRRRKGQAPECNIKIEFLYRSKEGPRWLVVKKAGRVRRSKGHFPRQEKPTQ